MHSWNVGNRSNLGLPSTSVRGDTKLRREESHPVNIYVGMRVRNLIPSVTSLQIQA